MHSAFHQKPILIIINHEINYLGIVFVLQVESREFFAIRYHYSQEPQIITGKTHPFGLHEHTNKRRHKIRKR